MNDLMLGGFFILIILLSIGIPCIAMRKEMKESREREKLTLRLKVLLDDTVREVIEKYMVTYGFDGLYSQSDSTNFETGKTYVDSLCSCEIGNLFHCNRGFSPFDISGCRFGYKSSCGDDCKGYKWNDHRLMGKDDGLPTGYHISPKNKIS